MHQIWDRVDITQHRCPRQSAIIQTTLRFKHAFRSGSTEGARENGLYLGFRLQRPIQDHRMPPTGLQGSDFIVLPHILGRLSDTLRSTSIQNAFSSSQLLISLVAHQSVKGGGPPKCLYWTQYTPYYTNMRVNIPRRYTTMRCLESILLVDPKHDLWDEFEAPVSHK